jgi:hypothetical protein
MQIIVAIAPKQRMLALSKIARLFQGMGISGEPWFSDDFKPMSGNSLEKHS